ncbi:MAG: hypothetical protein QOJ89_4500 [bacterium]|jgi:SAM-dependent methyltransferase
MSGRVRSVVGSILFRYGWDTRGRHTAAVALLREVTRELPRDGPPRLLDVGCGRAGMAAFLDPIPVAGVDLRPPDKPLANRTFTLGSITDLPFPDSSFSYVSCIDVLQELSERERERGVAEMLRVARDGLVIAAPIGATASRSDAELERALLARGAAVPPWVRASRANPYPTLDAVLATIGRADPAADVRVSYCENIAVTRIVRAAAVRSSALYALANLGFGLLSRAIPDPDGDRAYRAVIFVRLRG